MEKRIQKILPEFEGKKRELIPILQRIQEDIGYLSEDSMKITAKYLKLPESHVFGVASFYSQFRFNPVGKYILKVCHGTACHVLNSPALTEKIESILNIKDGETTKDGLFTLESVACLGCCSLAPVMMTGDEVYGKLDSSKTEKIIKKLKKKTGNLQ